MGRAYGTYGEGRGACLVLVGEPKETDDVENQAADGSITPQVVCKKWVVEA